MKNLVTGNRTQLLRKHFALLGFILWATYLSLEFVAFRSLSYVPIHENGDSFMPILLALAHGLRQNGFGFWYPYLLTGTDHLSTLFTSTLFTLPYLTLPGWLAYGIEMWLQRFVAGYFTYRLLKDTMKLNTWASLYAGLAYALFYQAALGGFVFGDLLFLPGLSMVIWVLYQIDRLSTTQKILVAFFWGVLVSLTSSYPFAVFLFPVIFFWFLFVTPRRSVRAFVVLLVPFVIGWALTGLPLLWQVFLNVGLSQRSDWIVPLNNFPDLQWYLLPNLLPLILIALGLTIRRHPKDSLAKLTVLLLLSSALMLASPLISIYISKLLGIGAGSFNFERVELVLPFLSIMGAAVALNRLIQTPGKLNRAWSYVLVGMILLLGYQSLVVKSEHIRAMMAGASFRALYEQDALMKLASSQEFQERFRVATVEGNYDAEHPTYAVGYGLETVDAYFQIYSKRYQRFWSQVIAATTARSEPFNQFINHYFNDWGNRVYLFRTTDPTSNRPLPFASYYNLDLLSLANVRYLISSVPLDDTRLNPIFSSDYETWETWQKQPTLSRLWDMFRGDYPPVPFNIYENTAFLKRYFVVPNVKSFKTSEALLAGISQATVQDFTTTGYLLENDVPSTWLTGSSSGTVRLVSYSADRIDLDVTTVGSALLVVSDSYSPYWQAEIDGVATKLVPADYTFQGVFVSAGRHTVSLTYHPFNLGLTRFN